MKLQIVDDNGAEVVVPHYGPLEVEFVESVVAAVTKYPVGFFRSQAKVEQAVRDGLRDVFAQLKGQTRYVR